MERNIQVSHENLYKQTRGDVSNIKTNSKALLKSLQLKQREKIISSKRFKVDSLEAAELLISVAEEKEKAEKAVKQLKQGRNVEALKILYRYFAKDDSWAETFVKSDGLPLLQSCFLSTDSEILHAATWCVINLSAGNSAVVKKVMTLSTTLIQFLLSSDRLMQELCAWALANLAGDCQRNRQILFEQGCIKYLVDLISSKQHLEYEERSKSVLFALINLAKDQTYTCVRCMQERTIYTHIMTMLSTVPPESDVNYELGWLVCCLYSRPETVREFAAQLAPILHLVVGKLSQLMQIQLSTTKEKVLLPYIHCIGNIIVQAPNMALTLSEDVTFHRVMLTLLLCDDPGLHKEILWLLQNFMAEPSCRVLIVSQPKFLSAILKLCHSNDPDTSYQFIGLVETMSKVSTFINSHLIQCGLVGHLISLLGHQDNAVTGSVLGILHDYLSNLPQETKKELLSAGCVETLQKLEPPTLQSQLHLDQIVAKLLHD